MEEVVLACYHGRVESLFVATDVDAWGKVDASSSVVDIQVEPRPDNHDLLNLAAIAALQHGGTVFALKQDDIPGGAEIAAVYRS